MLQSAEKIVIVRLSSQVKSSQVAFNEQVTIAPVLQK